MNAGTLPDPWHCPHCASDSESDGEKDKKMSASGNAATSSNRMKADENLDSSDSADAASTSSAVKMPGMIADTTAKPCDEESKSNNLSGQSIEVFHSKYHCPRTFYSHNLPLLLLCRSNPKGKHAT